MVGLQAGTDSRVAVFGGILTIAIADALSDALGIHVAEESEGRHTSTEVWESTLSTVIFKFIFASTFLAPILLFDDLSTAVIIGAIWGLSILTIMSYSLARDRGVTAWKVITEHLAIALVVIALTHYVGNWISSICEDLEL